MCSTVLDVPVAPTSAMSALGGLSAAIDVLAGQLGSGGVRDTSHEELTELVSELRRSQARLESLVHTCIGEVDARGTHVLDGALTASAWVRQHTQSTPAEAHSAVRTARALRDGELPEVAAAFAAGDISVRAVQTIARGVDGAPPGAAALIEPEALEVAKTADTRAVAEVMRSFAHALDPDGADEAAMRRYERAGITLSPMLSGAASISGTADETSHATIASAIDLAEPRVRGDGRTAARRRLDGLVAICKKFLADAGTSTRGGGHANLMVTCDVATLSEPADARPDGGGFAAAGWDDAPPGSPGGTLSWVGRIAGSTARRVGCDALATYVSLGPDGEIVEVGSAGRYFNLAQRRAMVARDGDRCCVPWCDRPVTWSDGHHIVAVADGGPTTVANGALPCEGHHVWLHEGRWRLERLPDGRYRLVHPSGRVVGPEPYPVGHNRPPPHRRE